MKHITKRQNNRIFNADLTKPGQNIYIDIVILKRHMIVMFCRVFFYYNKQKIRRCGCD